jgi:hypothetical protein
VVSGSEKDGDLDQILYEERIRQRKAARKMGCLQSRWNLELWYNGVSHLMGPSELTHWLVEIEREAATKRCAAGEYLCRIVNRLIVENSEVFLSTLWLEESFINLYRSYGWDIFEGIVNLDPRNICEALPEKPRTVHMGRDHSHNLPVCLNSPAEPNQSTSRVSDT